MIASILASWVACHCLRYLAVVALRDAWAGLVEPFSEATAVGLRGAEDLDLEIRGA